MAVATACFGAAAVAAAMPATAFAAPQNASAQNTAQTQKIDGKSAKQQVLHEDMLHQVVVNGFISSLQNAIAIQKNANSIVEAVSSQQIGQLPGTSIADALGRLPGLAVQTVNGRPQELTIHGMSSDFISTQVDGTIQPSTANNRDVQLDQYPPSWFTAVIVHFSPSADMIDPGIAGTVDMKTMRPLSQSKPVATINANYQWITPNQVMPGPGVSDSGHDINGVFADQFLHHTLGVTFGVDLEANPSHILHQAPWGYATTQPNNALIIGGSKNYNISDMLVRNGFLGGVEWHPWSGFTSTLDLTYENTNETQQAKGAEFPLGYGSHETIVPGTLVNGFYKTGTFQNVYPVIRNDYNHYQARVYNVIWHNHLRLADNWVASLNGSYSRAERDDMFLESYSGYGYNGPANEATLAGTNVNFSEGGNGELYLFPSQGIGGSNIVLTDPQGWGAGANLVQAGFINQPHTEDYIANVRLAATHYFQSGPISSMELGVDRRRRNKSYSISQAFLVLPGASCGVVITSTCTPTQTAPIPASALQPTTDALGFMGIGPQVMYNPFSLIANGQLVEYPTSLSSIAVPPNWIVNENDTTGYLQFNLHADLGESVGLRGNFGLQVAHTGQTSEGQRVAPGSTTGGSATTVLLPTMGGTSYTRYLPSLNLVFSLPHNNDIRASVARTMSRPRMDNMSASLGVSTNVSGLTNPNPNLAYFSGTGGNPALLPTMSTNYNLSLEHYFSGGGGYACTGNEDKNSSLCATGGAGYVQLSGYYLDLTDYINPNAAVLANFAPYASGYLTPAQQAVLGTTYGILTVPNNQGTGHIYGWQVATNLPLGDFTRWLNGFGVLASVDRTNSAVYYPGNTQPVTVEGLSKWDENFTLYYQYRGFQANVSDSIRSSYLGRVFGISATRVEQIVAGQATVDAQLSYAFQRGMLDGLTLIATGSNLTNQGMQTYQNNDPRQVQTWEQYGRVYSVGFSYNFK